jgi:DNA-binding protein HU-beta
MNKAELVEKIALHTKIPKVQAEAVLDATLLTITQTVAKGEDVKLVGFGSFSRAVRKSREGRNPKTGETVKIPGTKVPKFKPGKEFKDRLK